MKNVLRFSIVLLLINLVAASILTFVYNVTRPRIEQVQRLVEEESLKQVMPESVGDRLEAVRDEGGNIKYWKVFKGPGSRIRGYIFVAKKYGYSSVIESMVGMERDGTITGVRILSQNETPGLGARIIEVVSNKTLLETLGRILLGGKKEDIEEKEILPYFTEQFKGFNVKEIGFSNDDIDAITGATISSQAVLDSIKARGVEILDVRR